MSGVDLLELDASSMLDIIHYVFEEDLMPGFVEEPQKVKSNLRSSIYETFYERPYANASTQTDDDGMSAEHKPYIPPTNPEDFDKVLGAPMGG